MDIRKAQLLASYYDQLAAEMETMGRHVSARTTRQRRDRCNRVIAAWRGASGQVSAMEGKEVPAWSQAYCGLTTK